jgi:5-methyltetrahydropteroyltriglutamate--homocysteine methyltransferase
MSASFHADQVGSLLRPAGLLQARQAVAAGSLSREELREREDAAIVEALARQRDVGIPVLSDGEFRRGSWVTDMAESVAGFVARSRVVDWRGPGGGSEASTSQVVGARLRQRRRLAGDEAAFLARHASGPFKVTLPAPSNFAVVSWSDGITDAVYSSRSELLDDVVGIIRAEVESLLAEGVPYVQLDAPYYSSFIDERERQRLRESGVDPDRALLEVVAADSACVAGLAREGATLALHVCRGNSRSRWLAEGAYDPIAEALLGTVEVDAFLLDGRTAVLGLVTTKEPTLESRDVLLRRIEQAARYVPVERLALSPQCGFASVAAGNLLAEADQWRKLELVVETARAVWG